MGKEESAQLTDKDLCEGGSSIPAVCDTVEMAYHTGFCNATRFMKLVMQ